MVSVVEVFLDYFGELEDEREQYKVLHPVHEILFVTLCAVIGGAEGWEDIETYGESKIEFLREHLPYRNGIPSDDTLRRFFRALDPKRFGEIFVEFVRSFLPGTADTLIAIDGKTSRRSHDGAQKSLHLVSAFASEARLVLAQVATDEKSNEITAIPDLLGLLDLRGATVSIDAMGCQREISKHIIDGGGDYILGLKGNQGTLHKDVELLFTHLPEGTTIHSFEEADKGHGRIELRKCELISDIDYLNETHHWPGLKTVACITSTRMIKDKTSTERRYYISSINSQPLRSQFPPPNSNQASASLLSIVFLTSNCQ